MKGQLLPVDRTAAVNAALETACPVIGMYLRTLLDACEDGDLARLWDLDLGAIALSHSTPDVEWKRKIVGEHGLAAEYAQQITNLARLRRELAEIEDGVWGIAKDALNTMLKVTP